MSGSRKQGANRERGRDPSAREAVSATALTTPSSTSSSILLGRLLAGSTPVAPLVDFVGNGAGPLRARTTLVLDAATVDRAVMTNQGATLVFENGDPGLPIVTGLLQTGEVATPLQELLVAPRPTTMSAAGPIKAPAEARLDGERVVLEGKREVVLKCGEASITLRSDGKMVLRGAYIESYSKGLNRIKGASVKIN